MNEDPNPWRRLLLLGFLVAVLLGGGTLVRWATAPIVPMPAAEAALQSDAQVRVKTDPWYAFEPADQQPTTGFIFYPGGRVDPVAYAPPAREIAAAGYLVVIPQMRLNLAFFEPNKAADVMDAYPYIAHWAVGGHSLGGAMAARFAEEHPAVVDGLVLWAAYPPEDNSLATTDLPVLSLYGTRDGLTTGQKIDNSRKLLPAGTRYVPIEGGNHGQFGYYGTQSGDTQATISRQEQQQQAIEATVSLLMQIDS